MGASNSSQPVSPPAQACAALLGSTCHPKGSKPDLVYGTSGFRTKAELLDHVFCRMGMLASLRSKALGGQVVGVMVTASHNPEADNGAKLSEPMGEMMPTSWEGYATALANSPDEGLEEAISKIVDEEKIDLAMQARVCIGRDTRASSAPGALAIADGATAMLKTSVEVLGLTTTPQLHFITRCHNSPGYGHPSIVGYNSKLSSAFTRLVASIPAPPSKYKPAVTVDCANGVGAAASKVVLEKVSDLNATLVNIGDGPLNGGCGADFVKMKQGCPSGVTGKTGRMATLDGDADRLIYFFTDERGFHLLDGDRLAMLMARFISDHVSAAGIREKLRMGVVQTAYSNGAATGYAEKVLGAENVVCAKTGVKNLHPVAAEMDIGIYCEANGHGTVLFSETCVALVKAAAEASPSDSQVAAARLLLFIDIINEAVGDAISLLLATEAALRFLDWDCNDWLAMYDDLPNRQAKVIVKDRYIFETTDAERKCVKPAGLQEKIDALVGDGQSRRAFVRPSGTEDVVRVYAEAASLEETLSLCQSVVDVVYADGGGIGDKPKIS